MKRLFQACALFLVACLVLVGIGANQLNRALFQSPDSAASTESLAVQEGETFAVVAARLYEQDLIASPLWFRAAAEVAGLTGNIKSGTFYFKEGSSYLSILRLLTTSNDSEVSITIPEGYTLSQIGGLMATKLQNVNVADWEEMTGMESLAEKHTFVIAAGKPDNVDLEGYLFPDTYRFDINASSDDVVNRLLDTMEDRVTGLDAPTGDAAGMTTHEILTLASIIEREVRKPNEMKEVADIFLKRLEIGMALQADSTVNYITGGKDPSINLDDRDDTDSPYNTYKYPGLPPGPISNPGLNALTAVMHPAENDYFYFLTSEDGTVYYAETFEEHVRNKEMYLE